MDIWLKSERHKQKLGFLRAMSEPYLINPPEMEKLLAKYRSGNVPPLAAKGKGRDGGLLDEELLEIFRKGFSVIYSIPCISIILESRIEKKSEEPKAVSEKSHTSRLAPGILKELSERQLRHLLTSCKYFQSFVESDTKKDTGQENEASEAPAVKPELLAAEFCECCPVKRSMITRNGRARACMHYSGMISFFMPIYVAGEIIAFMSTECKKPKAEAIWPRRLIEQIGLADGSPFPSGEIDLWQESKRRIQRCEEKLSLKSGELLRKLYESVKMDPTVEVSPEDFETIMGALDKAGKQLADLANIKYRSEKESIIGWIRAEMASALSSPDAFWERIQWCFGNLAQLVGADYILLISRNKSNSDHSDGLHLQCQYGLPQESLPTLQYDWEGSMSHVDDLIKRIDATQNIQEINLREYRDVPILSALYSLYGKGVGYPVLVIPATTLSGNLNFMILGKQTLGELTGERREAIQGEPVEANVDSYPPGIGWLRGDDRQHLMTIVRELAIITNVFYSMNKLQETLDDHTNFIESVSHDLRTPIQNIMIAAENLRECRIPPERTARTITGVVTQLERLDLLAQKAWMLEQLRVDKLMYNDGQAVSPYNLSLECRDLLIDMAERKAIDIHIGPGMKHWQDIHVDAEIFRLVVLNLLHNGIKYSFPNTHIRVGGWQDGVGIGVAMTFENEGISIHDEEKDRIFERYFRSKDAIKMDPAGSGIGLALVKEFVEHYKGKIDVRSTEVGFGRYMNVFSLFLPGR